MYLLSITHQAVSARLRPYRSRKPTAVRSLRIILASVSSLVSKTAARLLAYSKFVFLLSHQRRSGRFQAFKPLSTNLQRGIDYTLQCVFHSCLSFASRIGSTCANCEPCGQSYSSDWYAKVTGASLLQSVAWHFQLLK